MAKIRRASSYRKCKRPYTRISKYKKFAYIKANPHKVINRYQIGNATKKFEYNVFLRAKTENQLRHNCLESARMTAVRLLEKTLGANNFFIKLKVYPFHILRENPLACGAGADRMSTGMQLSFGKPISSAAQVKEGKDVIEVNVDKAGLETAKKALKRSGSKLSCGCYITISSNVIGKAPAEKEINA